MAGALLSAIVERLGSFISSEFKLTVTVKEEERESIAKYSLDCSCMAHDAHP